MRQTRNGRESDEFPRRRWRFSPELQPVEHRKRPRVPHLLSACRTAERRSHRRLRRTDAASPCFTTTCAGSGISPR